jgi:hypothetical protein
MPYERPGNAVPVTAGVDTRHGDAAADDGQVGRAIKTLTPAADALRANRNLILAGEKYNIRVRGVMEVDNTNLAGAVKGDLVYITTATNAISNAAGAGKVVLGKIVFLPGEQGTPANRVRVDLQQKV